jgi:H+-transporting ATPase
VSPLGMILLVFLTDFAKIALATDSVEGSSRPERWALAGPAMVGVGLGLLMIVEVLGLLAVGWQAFDLGRDPGRLHTFTFQALLFFALFSVLSIRERRWFWMSRPSALLLGALAADAVVGTALSTVGLPGLTPVPWPETATAFAAATVCGLGVNDAVKVALIRTTLGSGLKPVASVARPSGSQGGAP